MQFTKKIFLLTLFIVGLIFLLGLLMGYKMDQWRTDDTQQLISDLQMSSASFVTESEFMKAFSLDDCSVIRPRLSSLSEPLVDIGNKLNEYDLKNMEKTYEFEILKRKYFLLEISTLSLNKQLLDKCNEHGTNIIYFYTKDEDESLRQGYVLDKFVKVGQHVNVFSFDFQYDDPALKTLKAYYNITKTPTMILDFNDKKEGYFSFGELLAYYNER